MSGVLKCMDTKGEGVGWMGDQDWNMYTIDTMYKIDDKWELTIEHRELYLMLFIDLNDKFKKEGR